MREKLLAGHAVRRIRRRAGLTQTAMAEMLGVSPSYLHLIERDQRTLSSKLLIRLADQFDFDPRTLIGGEPAGGAEALRRRLANPMFADLEIDRHEVEEWLAAAPRGAEAFARAFDHGSGAISASVFSTTNSAITHAVRQEIERWRNHFADLEAAAEGLADDVRLVGADLYGALVDRLRVKHGLSIRILPTDVMPDRLRRLDLHARQLQISEMLDGSGRTFALAFQLAQLEARAEVDALTRGAAFADRNAERLFRRHLLGYFAAAVMMPYARFLRACEASGYDLVVLQKRFGSSFEQVAHRLTTLQRVGARGLAFFMIRIDRAGQSSKRYAGASGAMLVEADGRCPLWRLHHAFDRPSALSVQVVELEDGSRWFTQAQTVLAQGSRPGTNWNEVSAEFAIGLGIAADQAAGLSAARTVDLRGPATRIGLGCAACQRADCPQRSAPPAERTLIINDRERGSSAFEFAND
ncbi:short-chain fatty acyl-CoA regulator family protein [Sphingomonas sp. ABOLF]|uniref:helix-turn-helix domain-containing protein n=1 Tax=Sphingomonas sp. ABOLF TaxID=1985879 RepID=UPI00240812BB|nr:short-chain fatty acyl-CoA regulator family protein [Sphingomonas sp. ABOLF]